MTKTQVINKILVGTNFRCRTRGGRYIFERTKNDSFFICDFQILPDFSKAMEWAEGIKAVYNNNHKQPS